MSQRSEMKKKKKRSRREQREFRVWLICLIACLLILLISVTTCWILWRMNRPAEEAPVQTLPSVSYDASVPFSLADLTPGQITALRSKGRMNVSDGPRGISVGDSMDMLLSRYPADYTGEQPADSQILYCASYCSNSAGIMTVLPPRGLLTMDYGYQVITYLAPTSAYPAGTIDNYNRYEHVFVQYRISPETMTIETITLGLYDKGAGK